MQATFWTILIIALATMFFGYYFGLVEGRVKADRKHKEEGDQGVAEAAPPALVVRDDPGLLRLKEENGQLQVEMDGVRVNGSTLAPEQRKRLIELITRLRPWVEGRAMPGSAPAGAPGSPSFGFASAERPMPVPMPQPVVPVTTPRKDPPTAPQSMVAQIDDILQEKIENTPLGRRGIKLEEAPGGTVNVVVGHDRYEGVGDVPDPEVQAAIRAAITEWERKFTPG
jgi:hypothetical protein